MKYGIDVSKWQGQIDWEQVKASGIEFAMLRAGYGQNNIDETFARNASECNRLDIPIGVYWFSYAYTDAMAHREAQYCLGAVTPYKLDYPIAFDFEGDSVQYAAKHGVIVTKALATSLAHEFCDTIRAANKTPMVYTNPNYLTNYFDSTIPKNYDIWLAKWPKKPDFNSPSEHAAIWQYTSSGTVPGISGRVDMNVDYKHYGEEDDDMDVYRFAELMDEYRKLLQEKPVSSWAQGAMDWAVQQGLIQGDEHGNTMPQDFLTREQFAIVMQRNSK